jgi:hypothetical protein
LKCAQLGTWLIVVGRLGLRRRLGVSQSLRITKRKCFPFHGSRRHASLASFFHGIARGTLRQCVTADRVQFQARGRRTRGHSRYNSCRRRQGRHAHVAPICVGSERRVSGAIHLLVLRILVRNSTQTRGVTRPKAITVACGIWILPLKETYVLMNPVDPTRSWCCDWLAGENRKCCSCSCCCCGGGGDGCGGRC